MRGKAFDASALFFAQNLTLASGFAVGTVNSSSVDLKAADIDTENPGEVQVAFLGVTSGGSATILVRVEDSADNSSFAAVTPIGLTSAAIAYNDASLADIRFTLPRVGLRRYVRLAVVVGTADLTGGTVNAGLVK